MCFWFFSLVRKWYQGSYLHLSNSCLKTLLRPQSLTLVKSCVFLDLPHSPVTPNVVLCLLGQSIGVQPEACLPLPVSSSGVPVLTAASEQKEPFKIVTCPRPPSGSEFSQERHLQQSGKCGPCLFSACQDTSDTLLSDCLPGLPVCHSWTCGSSSQGQIPGCVMRSQIQFFFLFSPFPATLPSQPYQPLMPLQDENRDKIIEEDLVKKKKIP